MQLPHQDRGQTEPEVKPHQDRGQTKLNERFYWHACHVSQLDEAEGSPFFKCVVSIWALPGWFGALFSMLTWGEMACKDGLEHLFHICPFDRGGGRGL